MIKPFASRQFLAFLVTGGLAAMVNFGSRILYNRWVDFSWAVMLAYVTGMVTAFILAKAFVFTESRQPVHHSAAFFVLVNLAAIVQTWTVSMTLAVYVLPWAHVTRFAAEISHAIGIAVPIFSSYIGHKRWSFR